jgi:hypothetical protein
MARMTRWPGAGQLPNLDHGQRIEHIAADGLDVSWCDAGGLVVDGGELGPGDQVRRGGKRGYGDPDLGDDLLSGPHSDAGDLIQLLHRRAKGAISSAILASSWAMSAARVSMRRSMAAQRKAWWSSKWPVSAWRS